MKKILVGTSAARANDKVFRMTLIDKRDGEVWNDDFASPDQTEAGALDFARRMFDYCAVVPSRTISTKPKALFWYGAAVGFAIACLLISLLTFIAFNNI